MLYIIGDLTRFQSETSKDNKINMTEVSKEASKAWKEIPANERQYWESVSKKDREEYERKLGEFEGPMEVRTDKVKKKVINVCACYYSQLKICSLTCMLYILSQDLSAPKRSPPAFFLFVKVKGPQLKELNPKTPHGQIVKECGKFWRNMSDSEKAPYREEEQNLRAQYHVDVEKWKEAKKKEEKEAQEKLEEERRKLIPLLESDEPESAEVIAAVIAAPRENLLNPHYEKVVQPVLGYSDNILDKPRARKRKNHNGTRADDDSPKRPPSAFFLFVGHNRPRMKLEYPDLSYQDMIKTLSQNWKALTDEQRRPFRDREEELREQYYFKKTHYKKIKKDSIRLKGGVEDQQQSENNIAVGERAAIPVAHTVQVPQVDTTEQVQQQPLTFAPLTTDDVQEVLNYQQEINDQEENHADYQHDLSYADYDPINVTATKPDGVQDESGEYNQHQISHQASIDYSAVGDYFGL